MIPGIHMKTLQKQQTGFTLIEIAIVLVIIGLLLGGILKGQELINSAKVKNLATDFRNIPVFIYGYQDKFKALPGDDVAASTHVGVPTASNGDGNGIIGGNYNATSGESFNFWQEVRLAGLAAGPTVTTAADYIPRNAVGGQIGITNAAASPITGLTGSYIVCSNAIPGKFAKQLDITLDDGETSTGSMMVSTVNTGGAPIAAVNIVDDTTYLVCMGF